MARLNTFHLAPALWREPFSLHGEEAHHLLRVLRAKPGQIIRLIDGQGRSGMFTIRTCGKKDVQLACISEETSPPQPCPLTLAIGWSKSVRRSFLLEKAVELGVSAIWFYQAKRSQGDAPDEGKESWERQLISAAKQCGSVWLPEIRVFSSPQALCEASKPFPSRVLCWEQHQDNTLSPDAITHPDGSIAVLGPEGGLEDCEAALFTAHGFAPTSLGPSILRFETAALYLLSLHHWAAQR